MDRVGALIHKLKEQYDQNVDKKSLLVSAQLLLAELEQEGTANASKEKVSVILPKVHRIVQDIPSVETPVVEPVAETPVAPSKPVIEFVDEPVAPVEEKPAKPVEDKPSLPETIRSYVLKPPTQYQPPVQKEVEQAPAAPPPPPPPPQPVQETPAPPSPKPKKEEPAPSLFDAVEEIPTLAHHKAEKEVYELNDVHIDGNSLNDKLKEEKKEVASTLKADPVNDLKRAVGINDRYRFINELFRGDEAMYERSIKTINAFSTHVEAETWIQRELKVKIGWVDTNQTVKDFDSVVKRRFS